MRYSYDATIATVTTLILLGDATAGLLKSGLYVEASSTFGDAEAVAVTVSEPWCGMSNTKAMAFACNTFLNRRFGTSHLEGWGFPTSSPDDFVLRSSPLGCSRAAAFGGYAGAERWSACN